MKKHLNKLLLLSLLVLTGCGDTTTTSSLETTTKDTLTTTPTNLDSSSITTSKDEINKDEVLLNKLHSELSMSFTLTIETVNKETDEAINPETFNTITYIGENEYLNEEYDSNNNLTNTCHRFKDSEGYSVIKEINVDNTQIIEEREMNLYSVGALLHDIGKVKDLDYFEGANGRDYERIKKHLFNSYALVSQTSEYPLEVILTVALHHEYYGLGYGPYEHLHALKLKKYPNFQIQRIMTYDAKAIDECEAFAYFPAKMLEIIDVYDALIDPARKYRGGKTFTPEEALNIMREDFIEKHVKLDPILYDVFVEFLSNSIEQDLMSCKLI